VARRGRPPRGIVDLAPTRFRQQHGPVERLGRIADERGAIGRPWRAVGLLDALLRRRRISPAMHDAGEEFRRRFRQARLDTLAAADPGRQSLGLGWQHSRPAPGAATSQARRAVWRAVVAAGGLASRGGSTLWRVLGLGEEDGADLVALIDALDALTRFTWSNER
jgi:hypothetical protein